MLTSGRMAIAQALNAENICSGDEVLLPAYHCSSMISPVSHVGASPVFYKIQSTMSVDLDDVESKITDKTRVLLIVHYFGFPQPISSLRELCDKRNLILIEDCAHAFFGRFDGKPVGQYGDYATGSLLKFFPLFDGGCLISNRHDTSLELQSAGRIFQLQSTLNPLEKAFEFGRLPILKLLFFLPMAAKTWLWNRHKDRSSDPEGRARGPAASEGGFDFDPLWINTAMSWPSRFISYACSRQRIIKKRRENFKRLAEALSDVPNCRPLFTNIPDLVVPYIFPLLVDQPDPSFVDSRNKGLPLLRWETLWTGVDRNTCPVSSYYSRHLIQIPCHQELKSSELDWMIEQIKLEFGTTPAARCDMEPDNI